MRKGFLPSVLRFLRWFWGLGPKMWDSMKVCAYSCNPYGEPLLQL